MSASILEANGLIDNAAEIVSAASVVGVPLWLLAAVIEKETTTGANVYGSDTGGVFAPGDPQRPNPNVVTSENYAIFESRVLAGETSNGVGPAQITHPSFICDAKARGLRLWVPAESILYGAQLLKGYIIDERNDYSDESIIRIGARYNGSMAYGQDLLHRAIKWINRLEGQSMTLITYPPASAIGTAGFWERLEAAERQAGVDVTCGPSYVKAGKCKKGAHGHWDKSRHWSGRALDLSMDPKPGVPISRYEQTHLTARALAHRARYGSMMGVILNRANDHKDHLHLDDGQSGYQVNGVYDYGAIGDELIFGRNGIRVERLQDLLRAAGYSINIDGSFGLITFDTVRRAQYDAKLVPDSIVGPKTLAALEKRAAELKKPTTPPKPAGPNYSGFTTTEIRAAQNELKTAGWYKGAGADIDGKPGPIFQKAMETAQNTLKKEKLYTADIDLLPGPNFMAAIKVWNTPINRVGGVNRYETAAALAKTAPNSRRSKVYLCVEGSDDIGATSAARTDGVILLVTRGAAVLPKATADALRALPVKEVIPVGDRQALTDAAFRTAVNIIINNK